MKTQKIFACIAISTLLASCAPSFADDVGHGKTRAEVISELLQAQADGATDKNSFLGQNVPTSHSEPKSTLTREEVIAEMRHDQADGNSQLNSFLGQNIPSSTGSIPTAKKHVGADSSQPASQK